MTDTLGTVADLTYEQALQEVDRLNGALEQTRADHDRLIRHVEQAGKSCPTHGLTISGLNEDIARLYRSVRSESRARHVLLDLLFTVDDMVSAYHRGQNLDQPAPPPTVEQIMTALKNASKEAHDGHSRSFD